MLYKGMRYVSSLKIIETKPYDDLQSLLILTYQWKNRSMEFVITLALSIHCKSEAYKLILVIVYCFQNIVHYKSIKVLIDSPELAKVLIYKVVRHHGLPNFIVSNWGPVFTFKLSSYLCYFLSIKLKISTVFYL